MVKQSKALQMHHDYYVRLYNLMEGKLLPEDEKNYNAAMICERQGLVKPLPQPWYVKAGLLIGMTIVFFGLMLLTSRFGGFLGAFQTLAFSFEGLLWILTCAAIVFNRN